jgi:hypothetical protein
MCSYDNTKINTDIPLRMVETVRSLLVKMLFCSYTGSQCLKDIHENLEEEQTWQPQVCEIYEYDDVVDVQHTKEAVKWCIKADI